MAKRSKVPPYKPMLDALGRVARVLHDIAQSDPNEVRRADAARTFNYLFAQTKRLSDAIKTGDMAEAIAAAMAAGALGGAAKITEADRLGEMAAANAAKLAGPNREAGRKNKAIVAAAYRAITADGAPKKRQAIVDRIVEQTGLGQRAVWKHLPGKKSTARR